MRLFRFLVIPVLCLLPNGMIARKTTPALQVMQRVTDQKALPVSLSLQKENGKTCFTYSVSNGKLHIQGSDNIALCRGFYDYMKSHHLGIYSWSGKNLVLPKTFADGPSKTVESRFANHYYFNVVTYGYSMPYWDWHRWEEEIDWMALHGVNMPLALVANEAISARVWARLGLSKEEINGYFVGPAHLPWMRMGNISGIDGPLSDAWHEQQIALQHKILKRMKELGMKPICPAFAGFIPKALTRLYPDVKITETTWGGAFHNWMLSPEEELFHTIGKMFIEEWEKEFGKNDYYIADSFNEMDIPFPPKDDPKRYSLLASYGERVYNSIKAGNKDAVWVMQGWMFGYMRDIWDYKTLQALVSKVPDEKMLLLDLAVDYNKHFWKTQVNWEFYQGFYNKPWVYSVIPNMGGKCGLTGVLEFYANGQWEALRSANKGNLVAFGMAPEGIENNEVIYELLSDAGWSEKEIDLQQWLKDYSLCRYGSYPEPLHEFWNRMLASVYGTFTDHPRYNWQFRPNASARGSINANATFFNGVEQLLEVPDALKRSPLFAYDLVQWTAAYVGGKAEILTHQIEEAYSEDNAAAAAELEKMFETLMLRMDALLAAFPTSNLQAWIDKARACGTTASEADAYERNARRIVTIWGPPVDDYSARIWSGLVRDYYLQRWKLYFNQKRTGKKVDFAAWEASWVNAQGLSHVEVPSDVVSEALSLLREASTVQVMKNKPIAKNIVASWDAADFTTGTEWQELSWPVAADRLQHLKGLRFHSQRGTVTVASLSIWADGQKVREVNGQKKASPTCFYPLDCKDRISGNNSLELKVKMSAPSVSTSPSSGLKGFIEAVY